MSAGAIVARKKNRRNPVYLTLRKAVDRSIDLSLSRDLARHTVPSNSGAGWRYTDRRFKPFSCSAAVSFLEKSSLYFST